MKDVRDQYSKFYNIALIKLYHQSKKKKFKCAFIRLLKFNNHIHYYISLQRLWGKMYSISSILLYEVFVMIDDTFICKTYILKFVLYLALLNFLEHIKSGRKVWTNKFFLYLQYIYIYIYKINFCPIFGAFL